MKKRHRFWLIYALVWLPYAASYIAIFVQQGSSIGSAISDALTNVVSVALLGVTVLWICRRLPWSLYRRPWFFGIHFAFAVLYALVWISMVSLVFTLRTTIDRGEWTLVVLRSYALQWTLFSGLMIYATIASVAYVLQVAANFHDEERRAKEMEVRAARAEALQIQTELTALRSKLNPHFLFNTLHTLMALVRNDRGEAEAAIERFSSMLRYVLRWESGASATEYRAGQTTLEEEWRFAQDYLALEGLRLGDRMKIESRIDPDALDARLPPFSLQPLIENAIKHSVAVKAKGGKVSIIAIVTSADLLIEVSDDGDGTDRDQIADSPGLGLQLIRKTLATQYEGRAQFNIETSPHQGFTVRLKIPQQRGNPADGAHQDIVTELAEK